MTELEIDITLALPALLLAAFVVGGLVGSVIGWVIRDLTAPAAPPIPSVDDRARRRPRNTRPR